MAGCICLSFDTNNKFPEITARGQKPRQGGGKKVPVTGGVKNSPVMG